MMNQLGKVTKTMAEEIDKLKKYLSDSTIEGFKNRISRRGYPFK